MAKKRKYGSGIRVTFAGEASSKCKYTDEMVKEIIKAKETMSFTEIEAAYGIPKRTVQSFFYTRQTSGVKIKKVGGEK